MAKGRKSWFDIHEHMFTCENPECGQTFKKFLRDLLYPNEVFCPKCGTAIDIRESKSTGVIGKAFDTASELDKQALKKD